jgi:hypothetical protein
MKTTFNRAFTIFTLSVGLMLLGSKARAESDDGLGQQTGACASSSKASHDGPPPAMDCSRRTPS